jgi:peptide/nickel transport system ATP-binding protein
VACAGERRDEQQAPMTSPPLLSVDGLTIGYPSGADTAVAVRSATFDVAAGERVGIVGESGSGKTTLALSLMKLLPGWAERLAGSVTVAGQPLESLDRVALQHLRGSAAGMVFQDPLRSFDPLRSIGNHLADGQRAHGARGGRTIRGRAAEVLRQVGMPDPAGQLRRYPHELSGGMRQRSLIALGMQNDPQVLIADEPTTALDVTIQAQIVELFRAVGAPGPWQSMALVLVSHNLGLVRALCTRVLVMYAGRIVEDAPVDEFFAGPRHPYAAALVEATPRLSIGRGLIRPIPGQPVDIGELPSGCPFHPRCRYAEDRCRTDDPPLLTLVSGRRLACWVGAERPLDQVDRHRPSGTDEPSGTPGPTADPTSATDPQPPPASTPAPTRSALVEIVGAGKTFRIRAGGGPVRRRIPLTAVDGVDVTMRPGETLALVGESGSGKSTLARMVLGLVAPTSGTVRVQGEDPAQRSSSVRRQQRIQAVFQDPHGSLDPRQSVRAILTEPLRNAGVPEPTRQSRIAELLDEVRLPRAFASRLPHELSGGQAQRVAVARALAVRPAVVVLDEPTASLDVSIQTHLISLLRDLQQRHGLTYLFVSHDLAAVRELASRIAVMYLGRIVEVAPWADFFDRPQHPYSAALLSALPRVDIAPQDADRIVLAGEPPSATKIPAGCPFHPRCPVAQDICRTERPLVRPVGDGMVACHFPGTLLPGPPGPAIPADPVGVTGPAGDAGSASPAPPTGRGSTS